MSSSTNTTNILHVHNLAALVAGKIEGFLALNGGEKGSVAHHTATVAMWRDRDIVSSYEKASVEAFDMGYVDVFDNALREKIQSLIW